MNDLRYSNYGTAPAAQPAQVTPAAAPRRAVIRRPAPPVRSAPPRPITNNVEVVRGTTGSNYEVGGYGS
jgi:hypothetical protein